MMTYRNRLLLCAAAPLLPAGAAIALLRNQYLSFPHLLAAAALAALLVAVAAPGVGWRRLSLSGAALAAAWCGVEVWLGRAPDRLRAVYHDAPGGYRAADVPGLGYAARPGAWRRHQSWVGTQLLYEVTYRMDARGWRIGPGPTLSNAPRAVVFLGCSFTFGVGLEADETLPALVERAAGGAVKTYNFAMDGYGPHQLLALLERGAVRAAVGPHERVTGFHLALPHHAVRAAGGALWGLRGPRYVLQPDGTVRLAGPFHSRPVAACWNIAYRSHVLAALHDRWRRVTARDLDLQAALVGRMRDEFRRQFGGPFLVLAWDTGDPAYPAMVARLRGQGLPVVEVAELVDGYAAGRADLLRPIDTHPTPACMRQVADGLAARGLPAFE